MPSHLYSGLREVDAHSQVLAHEHIRIVRLSKSRLEFLQLVAGKRSAESPLLPFVGFGIALALVSLVRGLGLSPLGRFNTRY